VVAVFLAGLRDLGYEPVTISGKPDHVVIDYEVQSGTFAGTRLKQGFIVPADFPVTPPCGIHIAAWIHPEKPGGEHPQEAFIAPQAGGIPTGARGRVAILVAPAEGLGHQQENYSNLHGPCLASLGFTMSRAARSVAMTAEIDRLARAHLLRADRQEDICFALWRCSKGQFRTTALIDPSAASSGWRTEHSW